ncbi:DUF4914 family protein [Sphaerochaeta sp. S2]|uniref:DUF4914 family protein n=1 Tax=Sphaerochaeta sp. S2 TaxID=2798868 RepID=UPI00351C7417
MRVLIDTNVLISAALFPHSTSFFFKKELKNFLTPALDPLGRSIIETGLREGTLQEYLDLVPCSGAGVELCKSVSSYF